MAIIKTKDVVEVACEVAWAAGLVVGTAHGIWNNMQNPTNIKKVKTFNERWGVRPSLYCEAHTWFKRKRRDVVRSVAINTAYPYPW